MRALVHITLLTVTPNSSRTERNKVYQFDYYCFGEISARTCGRFVNEFSAEIDQSSRQHSKSGFYVFMDHVFAGANVFGGFISIASQVMRNREANIHISQRPRQENKTKF